MTKVVALFLHVLLFAKSLVTNIFRQVRVKRFRARIEFPRLRYKTKWRRYWVAHAVKFYQDEPRIKQMHRLIFNLVTKVSSSCPTTNIS